LRFVFLWGLVRVAGVEWMFGYYLRTGRFVVFRSGVLATAAAVVGLIWNGVVALTVLLRRGLTIGVRASSD
jgi:hypothetical protein